MATKQCGLDLESTKKVINNWHNVEKSTEVQRIISSLATYYVLQTKEGKLPRSISDPVANFHLKNGATLKQVNFLADMKPIREKESLGTMVNYLYISK